MNTATIKTICALIVAIASPMAAQATSVKVEQLPRVVVTGKSQAATQQIVQLPRVVVEGRSTTQLALSSTTKHNANSI